MYWDKNKDQFGEQSPQNFSRVNPKQTKSNLSPDATTATTHQTISYVVKTANWSLPNPKDTTSSLGIPHKSFGNWSKLEWVVISVIHPSVVRFPLNLRLFSDSVSNPQKPRYAPFACSARILAPPFTLSHTLQSILGRTIPNLWKVCQAFCRALVIYILEPTKVRQMFINREGIDHWIVFIVKGCVHRILQNCLFGIIKHFHQNT